MVKTTEIQPNNYAIDFTGLGVKRFDWNKKELSSIIRTDIEQCFPEITYINTYVRNRFIQHREYEDFEVRIALKTQPISKEEKDKIIKSIEKYLQLTFITENTSVK